MICPRCTNDTVIRVDTYDYDNMRCLLCGWELVITLGINEEVKHWIRNK